MTASSAKQAAILLLFSLFLSVSEMHAQTPEDAIVQSATNVLNEVMAIPAKRIPQNLLARAQGVAIIPRFVKGGFVVGVRHGRQAVRDDERGPLAQQLLHRLLDQGLGARV